MNETTNIAMYIYRAYIKLTETDIKETEMVMTSESSKNTKRNRKHIAKTTIGD